MTLDPNPMSAARVRRLGHPYELRGHSNRNVVAGKVLSFTLRLLHCRNGLVMLRCAEREWPRTGCQSVQHPVGDIMTEVFLGQILPAAFAFAPKNFALCNGQFLPINQNQALFSLLGTQYGGDGQTMFALPDMRSRTPVGFGSSADPSWNPAPMPLGTIGGSENVTLLPQQLPAHSHLCNGTTTNGSQRNPTNALYGTNSAAIYGPSSGAQVPLSAQSVGAVGGTQPHPNMQPYSVISYSIALAGIFPSRN